MYGTRDAALNWANEYIETLRSAGFEQGTSNTCLFNNAQLEASVMVQVDPLASEELQVLKDHVALLAEKAQKDQKAPLVSVVTLYVLLC